MAVRIVQLGNSRKRGEGLRLGTVRRPPRGVRKVLYARQNWFDIWLPNLAPSAALMRRNPVDADGNRWPSFARGFEAELKKPDQSRLLDVLAAMSHRTNFSIGCYCADEHNCHRSVLRKVLRQRGADVR